VAERTVEIVIPYAPRPLQWTVHQSLKRFNVLVCHRRFGKTVLCINELIKSAIRCTNERPRFAYIAPLYRQAKQAAWDYLKHFTHPIPGRTVYESELRVDLPHDARIQLFGADNPDALRGIYLDGVVLDEYAQMPPSMWAEVLRPLLTDRLGWAIFIGTPKGRNAFFDQYEQAKADSDWYAAMFKASETGIIPADELKAASRAMSENQYAQEFECSFEAAIPGAYYGKLMAEADAAGRICGVPHDPAAGVETWWDLGIGDATAIWFMQRVGREYHAIDYYEAVGEPLAHYVGVINAKGWNCTAHILPHDAAARELQTGQTRVKALENLKLKPVHVMPAERVEEGIEAVRRMIPMTWFDRAKCARGIEALRQYRQDFDEKRQAFANRPFHDWTSHACDAFRQGALFRPAGTQSRPKQLYPNLSIV
jgi:phage terminase large subunit